MRLYRLFILSFALASCNGIGSLDYLSPELQPGEYISGVNLAVASTIDVRQPSASSIDYNHLCFFLKDSPTTPGNNEYYYVNDNNDPFFNKICDYRNSKLSVVKQYLKNN